MTNKETDGYNEKYLYTKEEKIKCFGECEWVDEPDAVSFKHQGFDSKVLRMHFKDGPNHIFGGFLNGYVRIPKDHVYYKKEYDDIECEVHGGLTYCQAELDGWWIGFDCAHTFDIVPSMELLYAHDEDMIKIRAKYPFSSVWKRSYKNINFVIEECKKLAEQMHNASL